MSFAVKSFPDSRSIRVKSTHSQGKETGFEEVVFVITFPVRRSSCVDVKAQKGLDNSTLFAC